MDQTQEDAIMLWQDVLTLLAEKGLPPAALAMFKSCAAESFDGETLHISTTMTFAQRKMQQQSSIIEECIEQAAFQHATLVVDLSQERDAAPIQTGSAVSHEEIGALSAQTSSAPQVPAPMPPQVMAASPAPAAPPKPRRALALADSAADLAESKLTFDRFVAGEENMMALDAAKRVADGANKNYNPLFIYGKSGLGKTHLLRAIQNYIVKNDPSRICVYRTAAEFVEEYRLAANEGEARAVLTSNYQDVDVLIIDDIQNMRTAAGTVKFFFDTFNALVNRGKQIVLAADRSPSQLGMGDSKFDERETSRMDSGLTVSVQVPDYELKLNLINAFYTRMKQDAADEHLPGMSGTIPDELLQLMAERSGSNIRVIEGFVHTCLMTASSKEQRGEVLAREDVQRLAAAKWPTGQRAVTVEQIQKAVESFYDVSHTDLVGSKRNKELMEPRHVGIWLTRELTDQTLADIGKKFGGRTHATVKHSIFWVDTAKKEDRLFHDRIETLKDSITDNS